jgi:sugar lactone lactonase YvrE
MVEYRDVKKRLAVFLFVLLPFHAQACEPSVYAGEVDNLFYPSSGIAIDQKDRSIYVSDYLRSGILKFSPNGTMTVFAGGTGEGSLDGPRTSALFNQPEDLILHQDGTLFVADSGNHLIRRISPLGNVSTLAGSGVKGNNPITSNGIGSNARFNLPYGLALDGNEFLFVSEETSIRKIEIATRNVTLLAGAHSYGYQDGLGSRANFNRPRGIAVSLDRSLYVADRGNHVIRRIYPNGNTSTLAGRAIQGYADALATNALFNNPSAISFDEQSNLIVLDSFHLVRKISPAGLVTTLFGRPTANGFVDGQGSEVRFFGVAGIAFFNETKELFISERGNRAIRQINRNGTVHTFTSTRGYVDGPSMKSKFYSPNGIAFDSSNDLIIVDSGNDAIRKVSQERAVTTILRDPLPNSQHSSFYRPHFILAVDEDSFLVSIPSGNNIRKLFANGTATNFVGSRTYFGFADGVGTSATFRSPSGLAKDHLGFVYVTDSANHAIRKISPTGNVTTIAGNGTAGFVDGIGKEARFQSPRDVAVDNSSQIYVADTVNTSIRKILNNGTVVTVVGFNGPGYVDGFARQAKLRHPTRVMLEKNNEIIFIDYLNNAVRKIDQFGNVATIIGPNSRAPNPIPPFIFRYWNPNNLIRGVDDNIYFSSELDFILIFNCSSNSSSKEAFSSITEATPGVGLSPWEDNAIVDQLPYEYFPLEPISLLPAYSIVSTTPSYQMTISTFIFTETSIWTQNAIETQIPQQPSPSPSINELLQRFLDFSSLPGRLVVIGTAVILLISLCCIIYYCKRRYHRRKALLTREAQSDLQTETEVTFTKSQTSFIQSVHSERSQRLSFQGETLIATDQGTDRK